MEKKVKTAISPTREENFSEWYQQVIKAADLAENAPVRGCMVIKPYGYGIWENIQRIFDQKIKDQGVENAYFPLLIPLRFFEREAEHVEGFAKECAVVTHQRLEQDKDGKLKPVSPLEEPYIIRPTSETIIGDAFSKWVHSYRDLPLKVNQWANIMRWEMRPRLFLRTSEFLWQEGHNVFATEKEAHDDALKMLQVYVDFAENTLALPVIPGQKTEDEKFPGAHITYTIEAMMQDGKALQSGTSHHLGKNFAKSSGIKFLNQEGVEQYAYTTSWGVSTRLIGGVIMTHSDDDGLVLPPQIAPYQIVIIPIIHDEESRDAITSYCEKIVQQLKAKNIRVCFDTTHRQTPEKIWGWIKKGVPVRLEVGQMETQSGQVTSTRRDLGKKNQQKIPLENFLSQIEKDLAEMQTHLLQTARQRRDENTHILSSLKDVNDFFAKDQTGFVKIPTDLIEDPAFEKIKKEHAVSCRCKPFDDQGKTVIIAKAY